MVRISAQRWTACLPAKKVKAPRVMKSPVSRTRSGARALTLVDDVLEEERLGVLVEVDVGDLGDAEAVEGTGQIRDGDGPLDDVDLVARDLAGVESECRRR